jgi:hypothetical protein
VRRGDKAGKNYKKAFPNLDRDTRPDAIVASILPFSPAGRKLFLLSNEPEEGFFAPLTDIYQLYTWRNFTDVLEDAGLVEKVAGPCAVVDGTRDDTAAVTASGNSEKSAERGGGCTSWQVTNLLLLYQLEKSIAMHARLYMDTFNYLTDHLFLGGCCAERPQPPPPGTPLVRQPRTSRNYACKVVNDTIGTLDYGHSNVKKKKGKVGN